MAAYHLIVDGSNVANSCKNERKKACFRALELVIAYLDELAATHPVDFEVLVDASLQYHIDDRVALDDLLQRGRVKQCPAGRRADDFIIEFYNMEPQATIIVSNDRFRDHGFTPAHDHALCDFMIVFDRFVSLGLKAFLDRLKSAAARQAPAGNLA